MSINQTYTIDVISTSPEGSVILTITDHYSWDEGGHLQLLQDKINAYLQFIESGQIFEDYPDARGKEVVIATVMKYEPNEDAILFLEKAKAVITNTGIGFQWRVLMVNDQTV